MRNRIQKNRLNNGGSRRSRVKRGGFTLMEILLVAAILVIMASMATLAFRSLGKSATANLALNEIKLLANGCEMFAITNQRYPNSLQDLFTLPSGSTKAQWGGPYMKEGDTRDPWGNEYQYSIDNQNERVVIKSYGPDQVDGGDDDISNIDI